MTRLMATFISLAGRARAAAAGSGRAVLAGQHAPGPSGDQTICEMPWAAHSGKSSASGACHSIEYCGCEETNRSESADVDGRLDLLGRPFAEAQVACLAIGDDLLQRLDRLLDGDVRIEAVGLVEVDVVGLQAPSEASICLAICAADKPRSAGSSDIGPNTLVAST